jgi:starch synthase
VGAGAATGVMFAPSDPVALRRAIARTISLHGDKPQWQAMQRSGMRADFSWSHSAARYAELFRSLAQDAV